MKYNWLHLEKQEGIPLYQQIKSLLLKQIEEDYLKQGERLPSIRYCAKQLQVSLTSVKHAYAILMEEGYIDAKAQSGYYVCVDKEGLRIREDVKSKEVMEQPKIPYDFRTSGIDENSFDMVHWKRCIRRAFEYTDLLAYGDVQGEKMLRKVLKQYVYRNRGVLCREQQMVIGASVQTLLYQLCGLLQSECVYMDHHPFMQAKQVFEDCHMQVKYCELETAPNLSKHALLYVNSASFGKEKTYMCDALRNHLIQEVKEKQGYLIEDDKNGELRYIHKAKRAMQGSDPNHIIYIGTLSKLLMPSLRIAYMVLPQELANRYHQIKKQYNPTASKMEQIALAYYIAEGHMERHLYHVRKQYRRKYEVLSTLLCQYVPEWKWVLDEGALRIYVQKASVTKPIPKEIAYDETETELIFSFASIAESDMREAFVKIKNGA